MTTLLIQHIETIWTKDSRGGDGARARNAVPETLELPALPRVRPFVLHHATFHEGTPFTRRDRIRTADDFVEFGLDVISLTMVDGSPGIRFHRDGYNAATPTGYPYKDVFTLATGEWGRLAWNGRYVDFDNGGWEYRKHVFNIGWFDAWDADVFQRVPPRSEFREMAKLR